MGNLLAKFQKAKWVDGGRVKESTAAADEDQAHRPVVTDSWGVPIQPPKEYDVKLVKTLIRQRRLAPFYEGTIEEETAEEQDSGGTSSSESDSTSFSTSKKKRSTKNKKKKIKLNKKNKDDPELLESSFFSEQLLLSGLLECPICLLTFPKNTNYTECCKQPICTSCFVKIKRPSSGRVISCPFCNHANFSVCYHKPRWLEELSKVEGEQHDDTIRPDPVACEAIKVVPPPRQRIPSHHQNPRNPRYYYYVRNNNSNNPAAAPRRYVFYEPSGSYTFYDTQYYRRPTPTSEAEAVAQNHAMPSYYQHYQQQEYQRRQSMQGRGGSNEREQLNEAIRQSLLDPSA